MKKIHVPPSVRRRARRGVWERLIMLAVYLIPAYVIADYIYEGLLTTNFGNLSTTLVAIYVIPFLLSGVPMKLIDRDYCGEIIKLTLKNNDRYKVDSGKVSAVKVTALIRTEDGKLFEREIFDEGDYFSGRERLYKESDKVVHVRWTDHLVPMRTVDKERPTACAVCGSREFAEAEKCRVCGCSLDIRVTDVKDKKR